MEEIKVSGVITPKIQNEGRVVFIDCGGEFLINDFILKECGKYSVGDRIVITISPCEEGSYYYPYMHNITKKFKDRKRII